MDMLRCGIGWTGYSVVLGGHAAVWYWVDRLRCGTGWTCCGMVLGGQAAVWYWVGYGGELGRGCLAPSVDGPTLKEGRLYWTA